MIIDTCITTGIGAIIEWFHEDGSGELIENSVIETN